MAQVLLEDDSRRWKQMTKKQANKSAGKAKKLKLNKKSIKDLTAGKQVKGGRLPESKHTYCGGDGCYKPNPY